MIFKVTLDDGAYIPVKANKTDAGYDLFAVGDRLIPAGASAVIDTGVHIQMEDCCGMLISKSGLNVNHDITSTGLIDSGYRGSIKVKLYNNGLNPYEVHDGDKISQIVFVPYLSPILAVADKLDDSDRGNKGFGSSGR